MQTPVLVRCLVIMSTLLHITNASERKNPSRSFTSLFIFLMPAWQLKKYERMDQKYNSTRIGSLYVRTDFHGTIFSHNVRTQHSYAILSWHLQ